MVETYRHLFSGTLRGNQNGVMNGGSLRQPLDLGRNYMDVGMGMSVAMGMGGRQMSQGHRIDDLPLPPGMAPPMSGLEVRHINGPNDNGDYAYGNGGTLTRQSVMTNRGVEILLFLTNTPLRQLSIFYAKFLVHTYYLVAYMQFISYSIFNETLSLNILTHTEENFSFFYTIN